MTVLRTGQVPAIIAFRVPVEGQAAFLTLRVPHGILLSAGARVRVDAGYALDLPIQTCEAQGCLATAQAPPELVAAMRGGRQVDVVVKAANSQDITYSMPLEGFAGAHDRVR